MSSENTDEVYDFGLRIKKLRGKMGWTQKELGQAIGVQKEAIAYYEKNTRYPPMDRLRKLALALHVTTDYLLGLDDAPMIKLDNLTEHEEELMYDFVKTFIDKKEKSKRPADLSIKLRSAGSFLHGQNANRRYSIENIQNLFRNTLCFYTEFRTDRNFQTCQENGRQHAVHRGNPYVQHVVARLE